MKALIITWVIIGFVIVAGVGFYVGRMTAERSSNQPFPMQGQYQGQYPTGTMLQPSGTMQQQPQGGGPQPSGGSQQMQFQKPGGTGGFQQGGNQQLQQPRQ